MNSLINRAALIRITLENYPLLNKHARKAARVMENQTLLSLELTKSVKTLQTIQSIMYLR